MRKTLELVLAKLQKYCAYQERCHSEVRSKIIELGIYGDDLDELISCLIEENYVNEERYALAFASDKFRFHSWGKIKISMGLKQKSVSDYCVKKALESIDENDYQTMLRELLLKKNKIVTEENLYKKRQKLALYAQQKGYESDLIWEIISALEE